MIEAPFRTRAVLALQRWVGRLLGVVWLPLAGLLLRYLLGYRIRDVADLRRRYRRLARSEDRGVLLCVNHLTMIDSAVAAWALGGSWWYVLHYSSFPWNLPERNNFAFNRFFRAAAWIAKCIPVVRGGNRERVSATMERVRYLLSRGETVLVFPEGGRSRSGRVEPDSVTYGVGRLLTAVPGCRTICVYLRGEGQESWSTIPRRGETFDVRFEVVDPDSSETGLRRARDLSRAIIDKLAEMEERHFARRTDRTAVGASDGSA